MRKFSIESYKVGESCRLERWKLGGRAPLTHIHEDFVAAHFDWIGVNAERWAGDDLAGGDVVLPAVPRARDHVALEFAFSQGPGLVSAYTTEAQNLPATLATATGFPAT